jgi:hypothetical protein
LKTMSRLRGSIAVPGSLLAAAALVLASAAPAQAAAPAGSQAPAANAGPLLQETLPLPDGRTANVFAGGVVQVLSRDRKQVEYRTFPGAQGVDGPGLPERNHLIADLMRGQPQPFAPGAVVVVFRPGVSATQDVATPAAVAGTATAPQYTNDAPTNALLGKLGVDRSERLFRTTPRQALATLHGSLQGSLGRPVLDFSNAYRLHVAGASVTRAVTALLAAPSVAYASPDWTVTSAQTQPLALPAGSAAAAGHVRPAAASTLPGNFAVSASSQSMLNSPSTNTVAAYDEVGRYLHQVPGQGEIVTNVSLGDLTDASATTTPGDSCAAFVGAFGPTTQLLGGQRFLSLPSLPLVPAYTADASGNLNGAGEVCGVDPFLGEVGLDFSVMSPLPHDLQRPGAQGSGLTDLLGIAPGASYRLVVPGSSTPTIADIDAALLGAAQQTPRPDIITASLGFGFDSVGFPGRYLEDDPLTEAVVAAIVHSFGVAVAVAANDGTRLFTNAAVGPTGGAAATDVAPPGGAPTNLNDVSLSTIPSRDFDSGSMDVGGTTLDDIFAAPPQYAANRAVVAQHAYPETRWTGFREFASGFGGRVNVSAPSDNILAMSHTPGGGFDAVTVSLNGGTSASAPEVAAAAAVVQQVARLTHQSFSGPVAIRDFLRRTGDAVPQVPQSDTQLRVGPQLNVGRAVETLLAQAGVTVAGAAPRVAIAQRRSAGILDGAFSTSTDPAQIDLRGPFTSTGAPTDRDQLAWITIAPDWEGLPANATFRLSVAGRPGALATTRWARLLPVQILAAAGLPLASPTARTVQLTYAAGAVTTTFPITFGPADATIVAAALAPKVPAVVRGAQIPVTYDLTGVTGLGTPTLVVSEPGRVDPSTGLFFHPSFTLPLTAPRATVQVPVSALQGGGVYGIGIRLDGSPDYSDFAFTRVAPGGDSRPAAPLLASGGSPAVHNLEIPFGGSFQVSWNVSGAPGATGATLEVAAAGPTVTNNRNTFGNPNGTVRDANGADAGSVAFVPLPGTSGTTTLRARDLGLTSAMSHTVRVLPARLGATTGEASDVSTLTMDGVLPADGGFVTNGYGISAAGFDGFLTSNQQTASGQVRSSVETFDRTSNAIVSTVAKATNSIFGTTGWGIWGGDVGLAGLTPLSGPSTAYRVLDPVAAGTVGPAWTPPYGPNVSVAQSAPDQENADGAFLAFDSSAPVTDRWRVFTSNVHAGTFGPLLDAPTPPGFRLPVAAFAADNATRTGVTAFGDFAGNCAAPVVVTTDLATGVSGAIPGVGAGLPGGVAVDSSTHRAAVPTSCSSGSSFETATSQLGIYDLRARTATAATFRGLSGLYTAVDEQHGLLLVAQVIPPDVITNNNSKSAVLVFDEQGRQQASLESFNLFNVGLALNLSNLQVDPAHRTAYLLGPLGQELESFGY